MITLTEFTVEQKREKAYLISAFIDDLNSKKSFWLPLSKIQIDENVLKIDSEFWKDKIEEIKDDEAQKQKIIDVHCLFFEEFDKTLKIVVKANVKGKPIHLWCWIAKSLIDGIEEIKDSEHKNIIRVPTWAWHSSVSKAIENQLQFYNQEDLLYEKSDFEIDSPVS